MSGGTLLHGVKAGRTPQLKPTDNEGHAPRTRSRKAVGSGGEARIKP